jgi:SAM-dependent methyltransferase
MLNLKVKHMGDRMGREFKYIREYVKGKGLDIGCGTNRLDSNVFAIDQQGNKKYAHADYVKDCHDLEISETVEFKGQVLAFNDNSLDFIFSSHCLEDFEDIPVVFMNWWKKLKHNGYMILLLPDMEGGRYPKCEDRHGNPSHRTNVGAKFFHNMLEKLKADKCINYTIVQIDTIPHHESCSIDIVIRKDEEANNA